MTEKAFDKAFQLEDNSESENPESNETTTLIESSNKKGTSGPTANASQSNSQRGPNGGGGGSTSNVLTAIEPLSLPSVVGSKPLYNNTEKTAGLYLILQLFVLPLVTKVIQLSFS